ncbi:glycosyltransferase, partial [bacterium]|nr:glycosyltransferase [bacterium]
YRMFLLFYPVVIEKFDFSKYDLVISDSSAWVKNIITPPETVHLSYIYNPMRFAWNFFHEDIKNRKWLEKFILTPITHLLRIWDYTSTNRIDHILSISQHVQKRVEKYYKKRSEVIYPFVDWDFFQPSHFKGDYFLLVSRMREYKKVDLAIKAFNQTGDKLVIIGKGEMLKKYKKMAKGEKWNNHRAPEHSQGKENTKGEKWNNHGAPEHIQGKENTKGNIIFIDSVDDDHLREYYAHCRAFIFPQEEDFGITPLESQSCGRPVIAYGKGGALETVKANETGIFFQKQTVSSLIDAIEKFKKIEGAFDKGKIREWAKTFSKQNFQKQFSEVVSKIIKEEWNNHRAPEHIQGKEENKKKGYKKNDTDAAKRGGYE